MTEQEIYNRFIFMPRMPHVSYLKLSALTSVFLNTFPYGAGVTSSESFSVCVPVVTLPSKISVLQMTLAQIRTYGTEITQLLVATDVDDYIQKVIAITLGEKIKNNKNNNDEDYGSSQESASERMPPTLYFLRKNLCDSRKKLFGYEKLFEAAEEWRNFLNRIL